MTIQTNYRPFCKEKPVLQTKIIFTNRIVITTLTIFFALDSLIPASAELEFGPAQPKLVLRISFIYRPNTIVPKNFFCAFLKTRSNYFYVKVKSNWLSWWMGLWVRNCHSPTTTTTPTTKQQNKLGLSWAKLSPIKFKIELINVW